VIERQSNVAYHQNTISSNIYTNVFFNNKTFEKTLKRKKRDENNKTFSYLLDTRTISVEILAYSLLDVGYNANRSRVSLRSTFSNCHVLFRYLLSSLHARHSAVTQRACDAVGVINIGVFRRKLAGFKNAHDSTDEKFSAMYFSLHYVPFPDTNSENTWHCLAVVIS